MKIIIQHTQNYGHMMTVLSGKFYIKKLKTTHTSELKRTFEIFRTKGENSPKRTKCQEIIKLRVEVDKIQLPFMIKVLETIGIKGTFLNIIKAIFRKPTANIKLHGTSMTHKYFQ